MQKQPGRPSQALIAGLNENKILNDWLSGSREIETSSGYDIPQEKAQDITAVLRLFPRLLEVK